MKTHDEIYEEAIKAIQKVFDDTSMSPEGTIESLQSLQSEIDVMIEAIRDDLRSEDED